MGHQEKLFVCVFREVFGWHRDWADLEFMTFPQHVCCVCSKQTDLDLSDAMFLPLWHVCWYNCCYLLSCFFLVCLTHSLFFLYCARALLSLYLSHTHSHTYKYTHTNPNTNTNTWQEHETLNKDICRVIWYSHSRAPCLSCACLHRDPIACAQVKVPPF